MLPLVTTMSISPFVALSAAAARCGTKVCDFFQYCNKFHNQCEDCSTICDESTHNFDEEICLSDCQNYLHDSRYVKLSDYAAEIKNLKIFLTVTFVLALLLLILFLAVHGSKIFKWCQVSIQGLNKNKNKSKTTEPVTMANPHTESPKMRRNPNNNNNYNRTSSIFTVTGTECDQKTVSTPISTRHPAEDTLTSTTTDFSYDNRALQLTPVSEEKPKIETTF